MVASTAEIGRENRRQYVAASCPTASVMTGHTLSHPPGIGQDSIGRSLSGGVPPVPCMRRVP